MGHSYLGGNFCHQEPSKLESQRNNEIISAGNLVVFLSLSLTLETDLPLGTSSCYYYLFFESLLLLLSLYSK